MLYIYIHRIFLNRSTVTATWRGVLLFNSNFCVGCKEVSWWEAEVRQEGNSAARGAAGAHAGWHHRHPSCHTQFLQKRKEGAF